MKHITKPYFAFAFVVSIGACYASKMLTVESKCKINKVTGAIIKTTTIVDCETSATNLCEDANFVYYADQNCSTPLKKN